MSSRSNGSDIEAVSGMALAGGILAVILAAPPLAIFLGIYFGTGELVLGAVLGFGAHFAVLAFSGRISARITRMME